MVFRCFCRYFWRTISFDREGESPASASVYKVAKLPKASESLAKDRKYCPSTLFCAERGSPPSLSHRQGNLANLRHPRQVDKNCDVRRVNRLRTAGNRCRSRRGRVSCKVAESPADIEAGARNAAADASNTAGSELSAAPAARLVPCLEI